MTSFSVAHSSFRVWSTNVSFVRRNISRLCFLQNTHSVFQTRGGNVLTVAWHLKLTTAADCIFCPESRGISPPLSPQGAGGGRRRGGRHSFRFRAEESHRKETGGGEKRNLVRNAAAEEGKNFSGKRTRKNQREHLSISPRLKGI